MIPQVKKKRGPKPGTMNSYWKIPLCHYCKEIIYGGDYAGYRKTGKPIPYHKACNKELTIIKAWVKRGQERILSQLAWHDYQKSLLVKALDRIERSKH